MSYSEMTLPEFDLEMSSTRQVLERVPEDKLEWKAHPKSNTIGWNACHLAEIPEWGALTLTTSSFDVAPPGAEPYRTPKLTSRQQILDFFDKNVAAARKALSEVTDEEMAQPWSLLQTGKNLFSMPRYLVFRRFVMSHLIHHRAILCVYLRLNDIAVPGLYGPSGDQQ